MYSYIIRRLLLVIPTIFLVSLMVFLTVRLIPGDIIDAMQAGILEVELDRPAIEKALGLDAPAIVQYGRWMGVVPQMDGSFSGVFQGDLGSSWWQGVPVLELAATRWPVTLELGFLGLIIAQLIALPVGIYSALRPGQKGSGRG